MKKDCETAIFKILRYNPDADQKPHYETYEVPVAPGLTVLEALYYILENIDNRLSFRSSCRAAVCGSCGMKIDGKFALACRTLVQNIKSKNIVIEPLSNLPLIKDLVVDMSEFYNKYALIEPYLVPKGFSADKESLQSPEERKELDGLVECILCGACYGACTMCTWDPDFPGPFALLNADARIRDTRDKLGRERILKLVDESGIWRCHDEFNCVEVCPKHLSPTEAIHHLKIEAVKYRFTSPLKKLTDMKEPPPLSLPPEGLSARRSFLKSVFNAGVGLITVSFLSLFFAPFFGSESRKPASGWIEVGPLPKVYPQKPVEVTYALQRWERGESISYPKRAYIVKSASGTLSAIDPTCTHLGCTCYWDESVQMFFCPCHGAAFDINGSIKMGPPPKPLAHQAVKVKGETLYLWKEA